MSYVHSASFLLYCLLHLDNLRCITRCEHNCYISHSSYSPDLYTSISFCSKIIDERERVSFWQQWWHPAEIEGVRQLFRNGLPREISSNEKELGPVHPCDYFEGDVSIWPIMHFYFFMRARRKFSITLAWICWHFWYYGTIRIA